MEKKRILSGMRPTGPLHLGHLVGALLNWAKLQDDYECFYMIADWHALMSEYADSSKIYEYSIDNVIDWLACGLDPEKSVIFRQSDVLEHTELNIILATVTPVAWLERVPTYKEQMQEMKDRDITNYAFLGYPVLQAADIIVYKAEAVPVGEDQVAHLELTREIVRRFNKFFGNIFPEPQPLLTRTPKLLGLDRRKMSKSYKNFIAISDPPEVIRKKVAGMFTDPQRKTLKDPGRPDFCNVFQYFQTFKEGEHSKRSDSCKNSSIGCTDCKKECAEMVIEYLRKFQKKRTEFEKDKMEIENILKKGKEKAQAIASKTITEVRKAIQF